MMAKNNGNWRQIVTLCIKNSLYKPKIVYMVSDDKFAKKAAALLKSLSDFLSEYRGADHSDRRRALTLVRGGLNEIIGDSIPNRGELVGLGKQDGGDEG